MFYVLHRLLLVCFLQVFFFFCNAHHNYVSLFVILFLFKKDIQRVHAKIHIPEFVSAALHVESWKQIRKGYGEREKVLKRYFNEQVAMNLFVVVFFLLNHAMISNSFI